MEQKMEEWAIVWIVLGIIANYQFMSRFSPFRSTKTYDFNENVYLVKEIIGKTLSFILFIGLFICLNLSLSNNHILISILLVVISLVVAFAPVMRLSMNWDEYLLLSFPETVVGLITKCEPKKYEIQGEHYKKVGMDTTCKVTVEYEYTGRKYSQIFENQEIKIFYTFNLNDAVKLTISTKKPNLVVLNQYLFDRPIEPKRYDASNYGEYVIDNESSCYGCGCD